MHDQTEVLEDPSGSGDGDDVLIDDDGGGSAPGGDDPEVDDSDDVVNDDDGGSGPTEASALSTQPETEVPSGADRK